MTAIANKHVARVGHEFAAAMTAETPIIEIAKMVSRLAGALDEQTALVEQLSGGVYSIPEMDSDLLEILGRPNFLCSPLAECLRADGVEIPRKSECEQAAVIRWMLNFYLQHGAGWRNAANTDLQRIKAAMGGEVQS